MTLLEPVTFLKLATSWKLVTLLRFVKLVTYCSETWPRTLLKYLTFLPLVTRSRLLLTNPPKLVAFLKLVALLRLVGLLKLNPALWRLCWLQAGTRRPRRYSSPLWWR